MNVADVSISLDSLSLRAIHQLYAEARLHDHDTCAAILRVPALCHMLQASCGIHEGVRQRSVRFGTVLQFCRMVHAPVVQVLNSPNIRVALPYSKDMIPVRMDMLIGGMA